MAIRLASVNKKTSFVQHGSKIDFDGGNLNSLQTQKNEAQQKGVTHT